MQPAAKKCLGWAGASAVAAVGLQLVTTYVPWLWSSGFDSYYLPTWYTVANLLAALVSGVLFPLAAVLIGVAILINVLVPRIGVAHGDGATEPQQHAVEDVPVSDRRDAVGIADASVYEPPPAP